MAMARSALVLAAWMLLAPAPLRAQAAPADPAGDLKAIRQSLDQIVIVLRQLVQQNAQRDTVAALTERITASERRLAPLEQELRTLQQRHSEEQTALANLQQGFGSIYEMAKMDTTGSAAAAIEAEKTRMTNSIAQKTAVVAQLAQAMAAVETDLAQRRETITRMDAQLDRLLTGK
jgi:chromosome segregation ATPase